jgi:outer membrane protein assembly factor BamB
MGLLTTPRRQLSRWLPALLACSVLLAAGCMGLRLVRPVQLQADDWPMFGRTPSRSAAVPERFTLPLQKVWEYDVSAGIDQGPPLVVDSMVFAGTMRGELYCLRLDDGTRLGWVGLGDAVHGSPVVDGNSIIVPLVNSTPSLLAYDLPRGRTRWKESYGSIETSLLLVDHRLYFGTTTGKFYCVDPATGIAIWSFSLPQNSRWFGIRSSPAAWGPAVLFGADDGVLYSLSGDSGSVRWTYQSDGPIVAPPAVDSAGVVVGTITGTVLSLDPASGQVQWTADANAPVYGNALLTPSSAVVATTGGTVLALARSTGKKLWELSTGGPVVAGPASADGVLFVGTLSREILAIDLSSGQLAWRDSTAGRIKTPPVIAHQTLLVATDDRTILAYREVHRP